MAVTARQFGERLVEAGLLGHDDLAPILARLPGGGADELQVLARELIQAGKLTRYQATAVYRGELRGLVLGNYVILDRLGEGGMGEVFRARHKIMEREVALKVLPPRLLESPDAARRFHREVKAAAKLEHPNIVTAYDADQAAGRHFLVMQFIDGKDLSHLVREHGPMTVPQALDCCIQAARGLAYAHAKGVVHRDIKPSNLLLDTSGTVKILDMGLARLDDQADEPSALRALTQSGQVMGTVDYMAPEQAEDTHGADQRSDIYSLGCTLYALLTAQAVFEGTTLMQKLLAHLNSPPPRITSVRSDAPAKLDEVLARMLAKKPAQRYANMDEVITALQACLAPSQARAAQALAAEPSSSGLTEFFHQLAAEQRRGTATKVSTAAPAPENTVNRTPGTEDTGTGITRQPRAASAANRAEARARPARKRLTGSIPWRLVAGGVAGWVLGLTGLAGLLVWQPWRPASRTDTATTKINEGGKPQPPEVRGPPLPVPAAGSDGPAAATGGALAPGDPQIVLRRRLAGHARAVHALAFHRDANRLASGGEWGELYLWDSSAGQKIDQLKGQKRNIGSVTFSPDGARLFSSDYYTTLKVWDVEKRTLLTSLDGRFGSIAISADGKLLAAGADKKAPNNAGAIFQADTLTEVAKLGDYAAISHVAFSHDGQWLAAGGNGGRLVLYRATDGKSMWSSSNYNANLRVAFSHDDRMLAAGGQRFQGIRLMDVSAPASGVKHLGNMAEGRELAALAWLPGSRYLAAAMTGVSEVQIWDTREQRLVATLAEHTKPVKAIAVSPDGRTLATAGHDLDVVLWDVRMGAAATAPVPAPVPAPAARLAARLRTTLPDSATSYITVSADGKLLADRHRGTATVRLWDLATGERKQEWDTTADGFRALAFGAPPFLFLGEDAKLVFLNTTDGSRLLGVKVHDSVLLNLAFSRAGRLATCGGKGDASVKLRRGSDVKVLGRHGDPPGAYASGVAFNADGSLLASGGSDGKLRVYDVDGANERYALDVKNPVHAVAFSPDGLYLASGDRGTQIRRASDEGSETISYEGSVKIGNLVKGQIQETLTGFEYIVGSVAFSPDGRLLAAACEFGQGRVRVFDLVAGGEPLVLEGAMAGSVAFLPTGHTLVTGSEASGRQFWEIDVPGAESSGTFTSALGMQFVRVPAGKSWLGGGGGKPGTRQVEFKDDFHLGKFEVTQGEWQQVMGGNPSWHRQVSGVADDEMRRFPVEMVSWHDAQEFVRRLNERAQEAGWVYRLPTEEEWEYACRGGVQDEANSGFDFYFAEPTNSLLQTAANFGNQPRRTCQVGLFAPNRLGLYDMHGNVEEWCAEKHGAAKRPVRGGDWGGSSHSCRAAERRESDPADKNNLKGLRVARVPIAGAWQPLFNGKDLTGWKSSDPRNTGKAEVVVDESEPVLQFSQRSGLLSTTATRDFHLRFDYKVQQGSRGGMNVYIASGAGVQLKMVTLTRATPTLAFHVWGITCQQADFQGGAFVPRGPKIGKDAYIDFTHFKFNTVSPWQRIEMVRLGDALLFLMNGQIVGAVTSLRDARGTAERPLDYSPVSFWSDGEGTAKFRNIEIRQINALPPELVEPRANAPPTAAAAPFDERQPQEAQRAWGAPGHLSGPCQQHGDEAAADSAGEIPDGEACRQIGRERGRGPAARGDPDQAAVAGRVRGAAGRV